MMAYQEKFPVGTTVRIAELAELERFRRDWQFHHKLEAEQLSFAGQPARVKEVGFYHGGDVLYHLDGVPGIWHEACVHAVDGFTRTT
ncbi:MAG: hypothetical protein ACM3KL_02255 [Alphaproteobacteria bacterium]